jgi:hypothetical protein
MSNVYKYGVMPPYTPKRQMRIQCANCGLDCTDVIEGVLERREAVKDKKIQRMQAAIQQIDVDHWGCYCQRFGKFQGAPTCEDQGVPVGKRCVRCEVVAAAGLDALGFVPDTPEGGRLPDCHEDCGSPGTRGERGCDDCDMADTPEGGAHKWEGPGEDHEFYGTPPSDTPEGGAVCPQCKGGRWVEANSGEIPCPTCSRDTREDRE